MAARVAALDWSRTPLGPRESWPRSLRIAVGICLSSRFPMFVWWGPERVNIYNDAYVPVLGKRHPDALGRPARDVWADIWSVVGPQSDAVLLRGEATWNERVLLVMERNGYPEETYFTWSYSPIPDDAGGIGGLFCACTEETQHVLAERERAGLLAQVDTERSRLAQAFAQSPAFIAVVRGPDHVYELVNEQYSALIGGRAAIGKSVREALPEVVEQGFVDLLDRVYRTGEPFVGTGVRILLPRPPHGALQEAFIDFVYQPMRAGDGSVEGIVGHGIDVTARVRGELRDAFLLALENALRPLADPAAITATAARLLGEHLDADRCAYADVEADEDTFNVTGDYDRGVPSIVGRYRFDDFGAEALQRMRSGRPYVVTDVETHQPPLGDLSAYRQTMIRSVVCVPLHKAGRLVAAMAVHQSVPRAWSPAEIELVRHVASRCWEGIERARIEQALRESEARFRNMSDNAPVMIRVTGPDALCEYLNAQWYAFTGQTEQQALGLGWLEALHPEDAARASDAIHVANAERRAFELEYRLRRADGTYRWCIDAATPRWTSGHPLRGHVGSIVDITDHKRALDALAWEKSVLELIVTGSPLRDVLDAIVRSTEAQSADGMLGSISMLDERGEHLLHGAAPSLPPAYCAALDGMAIGPDAGSCGSAAFLGRRVITPDIAVDPRWERYRALAAEHGLRACSSKPISGSGGQVLGTVATYYRQPHQPSAHDLELLRAASHLAGIVLEKHRVDSRLTQSLDAEREARAHAERANRMKDEFLATLSHELRTPLNAILGWSRILGLESTKPAQRAQGVSVIQRNALAQARIIDDLLDMSAFLSGKVRLELQPLELAEIARAAIETARPTAEAKGIRMHLQMPLAGSAEVRGDPSRLQQVLWNLLSNAIKFTSRGGHIEVVLERVASHVELRVRDDGEGIRPEFVPFVFDRFRQADASTTRTHGGLGLGLSIVKQLVELHGGAVRAESDGLGRGATFVVQLPLAAVRERLERATGRAPAPPPAAPVGIESAGADVAELRVLVVDDDPDARDLVSRLLAEHRAEVTTAGSAAEAMERISAQSFDVLVTDIGMPGEDGYSLLRRVRSLGPDHGGDLPAVALTAYARPEDRLKAIHAGFQTHVAKPVDPAELIAIVASLGGERDHRA